MPPRPRRIEFPPTRLLLDIAPKEETPARTPWWLILLRMVLAGAVILGLAMQDLLGNIFAGVSIHISKPFKPGDWLIADNQQAEVIEVNWRSTRLRTNDDTYLDVRGANDVIDAVKRCWASLWADRAVTYRHMRGIAHDEVSMAVVVQAMIASESSGVMFTGNPLTAANDEIVINEVNTMPGFSTAG